MKKPNIPKLVKAIKSSAVKHTPEILTGLGIAGMVSTTIMAVRATPKAILILNEEECKRSKQDGTDVKISKRDAIKLTWKCYIPSCAVGGLSIMCLVGASSVSTKRQTALATAYTLTESALKEYQGKVIETIGEKKELEMRDSIAKDQLDRNPIVNNEVIIAGGGDTLCYDPTSGRYFRIDINKLKRAEHELNRQMFNDRYASLNDFYYIIGLEGTSTGNDLGWNVEDGNIELYFTSQLTPDDTPCVVINYRIAPKYEYYKLG